VKPTLLIVEDDEELQELYTMMLEAVDCEIVLANDGAEALDRLDVVDPQGVILDILLHGMMGDEFFRALRRDPRHRQTPVVVVSVLSQERCEEVLDIDAWTVFLRKPFRKQQLVEAALDGLDIKR
jgi:CheY-like chemotaxis protein